MDFKQVGIILLTLTLLIGTACAAAPTISDLTVSPTYTNDKNYFDFPVTLSATATGADLNADNLCYYYVSTGGTAFDADWNGDTNTCSVTIASGEGVDDWNFSISVQSSTLDANGDSPVSYYWRDSNAPNVSETSSGEYLGSTVTITCADVATNTGDGSGCKTLYYSTNGGTSYSSTTQDNVTIQLNEIGSYDVNYYAVDNLDNTTSTSQTSYTITSMPASNYAMISIALFIAAVSLVIFAVMKIFRSELSMEQFIGILVAVLIALLVAWTIYGTTIVVV